MSECVPDVAFDRTQVYRESGGRDKNFILIVDFKLFLISRSRKSQFSGNKTVVYHRFNMKLKLFPYLCLTNGKNYSSSVLLQKQFIDYLCLAHYFVIAPLNRFFIEINGFYSINSKKGTISLLDPSGNRWKRFFFVSPRSNWGRVLLESGWRDRCF